MKTLTLVLAFSLSFGPFASGKVSAIVFTESAPKTLISLYEIFSGQEIIATPDIANLPTKISFGSRGVLDRSEASEAVAAILKRQAGILIESTPSGYVRARYDSDLTLEPKSNALRTILNDIGLLDRLEITSKDMEMTSWVQSDLFGDDWVIYVPDIKILPQIEGKVDRATFDLLINHLNCVMEDEEVKIMLMGVEIVE